MPQFPVTESRAKILAKIPDYAVQILPCSGSVRVSFADTVIAESKRALLVRETKHADVFYIPREDVLMDLFERTQHSTYCPFKGHASYWTLSVNGAVSENIVWSYEDPYPEVIDLKDYMSFYTDRTISIVL